MDAFTVYGFSQRTNNQAESSAEAKISGLWTQFLNTHPALNTMVYGVYSNYDSDAHGDFSVTVGSQTVMQGASKVTIQAGTYLAITVTGPMPQAMVDAWAAVWLHFSQPQPYQRL